MSRREPFTGAVIAALPACMKNRELVSIDQQEWNGVYAALSKELSDPGTFAQRRETLIDSVPAKWPRRLLHVETMTSLERQSDNTYGHDREPAFAIVSYKWGHWVIKQGSRLYVYGITRTLSIPNDGQ